MKYIMLSILIFGGCKNPSTDCHKETVKEIIGVSYRSVAVKTEEGNVIHLYQPTVIAGTKIEVCESSK